MVKTRQVSYHHWILIRLKITWTKVLDTIKTNILCSVQIPVNLRISREFFFCSQDRADFDQTYFIPRDINFAERDCWRFKYSRLHCSMFQWTVHYASRDRSASVFMTIQSWKVACIIPSFPLTFQINRTNRPATFYTWAQTFTGRSRCCYSPPLCSVVKPILRWIQQKNKSWY